MVPLAVGELILKSSKSDDPRSTEQFVRLLGQHEQALTAFILALVPDWHAAHDLAQETRLRLWEQFDEYDPDKDFGAWARTIARYEVLHYRTRKGRQKVCFSDEVLDLVAEEADEAAGRVDARQGALARCLERLSEVQRNLLTHCYVSDKSLHDVATELGQSYEAVRKRVFRIRRLLHQCIDRALRVEAG